MFDQKNFWSMILQPKNCFDQKVFINFSVDNYSWGNDLATIKNYRQKIFWWKLLVERYSWGNDFAIKEILDQTIFCKHFLWITILEEMILQGYKFFDRKMYWSKLLVDNYFWGNGFAMIKHCQQKIFCSKFFVNNYSWRYDFATIKKFVEKICLVEIFSG
jgi:hypothetical protein